MNPIFLAVVEGLEFMARFGPSGPKPDSHVVINVSVDFNFVEKVCQVVCRLYFWLRPPSCQICRCERLGFVRSILMLGIVEVLEFMTRFGPSGPKPDSLVVINMFVDVNFVGKVCEVVCRVYFGLRPPSYQKCRSERLGFLK